MNQKAGSSSLSARAIFSANTLVFVLVDVRTPIGAFLRAQKSGASGRHKLTARLRESGYATWCSPSRRITHPFTVGGDSAPTYIVSRDQNRRVRS